MAVHAESRVHQEHLKQLMASDRPMRKLDSTGDKRLIRGGGLLRALGLDELPQLVNVIRGEMSLVGPRPSLPYECELYRRKDWQRFESLPGLTGLWQVSGKNRTTFDQMIDLDIKYVDSKSLLLDIKILLRTAPAILDQVRGRNNHVPFLTTGFMTGIGSAPTPARLPRRWNFSRKDWTVKVSSHRLLK